MGGEPNDDLERLLAGDSATVIDALKQRLADDPDDAHGWLQLAIAYSTIEHWGLALSALERAVALDEHDVDARLWYARVLTRLRRPDKAAYQLVQAKRLAPDDARVARQLGVAFYDKGLFDKALGELERARSLDPEDARTHYAVGLVHEAQRAMAAAIGCYREAVRLQPDFCEAKKTLADALAQMGEIDEAIAEVRQLLALERHNPQNAINLEVLEQRRREIAAARLIGKSEAEVARSVLVERGGLVRHEHAGEIAYESALCELRLELSGDGAVNALVLRLPNPAMAASASGAAFGVSIVRETGDNAEPDFATAASLTFLREALGCTMTQASELYARLLATHDPQHWAHCEIAFTAPPGLRVRANR